MAKDASIGVNLIGRDVSASKTLNTVGGHADKLAGKLTSIGDKAVKSMALLAAGAAAAAVKIGVDSVKAAIEDAKSQTMLQAAIHNSTKATNEQSAAVEKYVNMAQLRFGVEDTKIRSGLGRLVTATHNVNKAQKLMTTSVSISAKTGKDLNSVTTAVTKAYSGNYSALSRLGIAIPATLMKTKDFGKIWDYVRDQVIGFGDKAANTLEGRLERMRLRMDEVKESIGYALLPYMEKFATYLTDTVIPNVERWVDENGPAMKQTFDDIATNVGKAVKALVRVSDWAVANKDSLKLAAEVMAGLYVSLKLYAGYKAIVTGILAISGAMGALAASETAVAVGGAAISANPIALALTGATIAAAGTAAALNSMTVREGQPYVPAGKNAGGVSRTLPGTVDYAGKPALGNPQQQIINNFYGFVGDEDKVAMAIAKRIDEMKKRNGWGGL